MKQITLLAALLLSLQFVQAQAGTLDSSFGVGGKVTINTGNCTQFSSMTLQPDGKLIVVGLTCYAFKGAIVTRFLTNGNPDSSFGVNGIVITGNVAGRPGFGNAVAVQTDGKIVVAGYIYREPAGFCVTRYMPDGRLDSSFGLNGIATHSVANAETIRVASIGIQKDGRIIVGGDMMSNGPHLTPYMVASRINTDGSLDSSFGKKGGVTIFLGFVTQCGNMAIQKDDKILLGGNAANDSTYSNDFTLVRLKKNGDIDSLFGKKGITITDFNKSEDVLKSIAIQGNGRIVIAGSGNVNRAALMRYFENGMLDSSFGRNGKSVSRGDDESYAMAIDGKGRIATNGVTFDANGYGDFFVARWTNRGSVDKSFDGDGNVITDFQNSKDWGYGIVIQPDNKIIAGGTASIGYTKLAISRYLSDDINTDNVLHKSLPLTAYLNIKLYPNPANNILHIQGLPINTTTKLTITDLNGNARMAATANAANFAWNISRLQKGSYMIRVEVNNTVTSTSFIKE